MDHKALNGLQIAKGTVRCQKEYGCEIVQWVEEETFYMYSYQG